MRSARLGPLAALVVLGVAGGGAVALARHELHAAASPRNAPVVDVTAVVPGQTVHVESGVPGTTFLPLGRQPQDGRTLSAQHAYNALVQSPSKLNPIPAEVRAYYGELTDASTSPMAVDLRVWAFAVEAGCTYVGSASPPGATPPPRPTHCRKWEFVNARTGHDLGVISQEVLPD